LEDIWQNSGKDEANVLQSSDKNLKKVRQESGKNVVNIQQESGKDCFGTLTWDDDLAEAAQIWADQCAMVEYSNSSTNQNDNSEASNVNSKTSNVNFTTSMYVIGQNSMLYICFVRD
jgi:hypothetical protein